MSANTIESQLARISYKDGHRGARHSELDALRKGNPYLVHDIHGTEITVVEGKAIVPERHRVPEEVRRPPTDESSAEANLPDLQVSTRSQRTSRSVTPEPNPLSVRTPPAHVSAHLTTADT